MAFVEPEEWKSILDQVKLGLISKRKVLNAVNEMRKKENKALLNIKDITDIRLFQHDSRLNANVPQQPMKPEVDNTDCSSELSVTIGSRILNMASEHSYITNDEDDPIDLEQIDVSYVDEKKTTLENITQAIPRDRDQQTKRIRMYLCCSTLEDGHVRSVSFPDIPEEWNISGTIQKKKKEVNRRHKLKLVHENTPWLYWTDFNVASNSKLSFNIFDRTKQTATETVSAFSHAIIVEEQPAKFRASEKSERILEHLVCEIENEQSLCFALAVFNHLKTQLYPSTPEDIKRILADNTPSLDQSNVSSKQVCTLFYFILFFYLGVCD
ncbi:hypothetical protein RFI_38944 [Reticulomyxa filosa]|uniref:Uncharacterized protein n=1 Tax=Reticulomyxa filosa TaxID=46433 RepID=X6LCS2_RETFI|nr:hypothetical protein RFI_38944 [Reticulomyxa filosa]|eukprot:ETN98549.1 hypothetical protein RFI_38944 [Reticulomyxa filosa]